MLYISLVASTLLLIIANWSARRVRHAGTTIVLSSLAFMIGTFFLTLYLPAVAIQTLLLCVAAVVWRVTRRGPSLFLGLSCGATVIAYGLVGIAVLKTERNYAKLRALYPYESMEDRVPAPQSVPGGTPLHPAAVERLSRLEEHIPEHANRFREMRLSRLHQDAVDLFVNNPGFGVARVAYPNEASLAASPRKGPVPIQPGPHPTATWSPGGLGPPSAADETSLGRVLDASILDFVNPGGFGLFKDRQHVAGFETHRFSQAPDPVDQWKVQALELVSLLLHDEPKVYVSSDLPQMDRLHGVPTRPLDRFEEFGLDAMRRGDDIFISQVDEGVRMLGAIRSTKTCVSCHGGDRGDLLGAFSYVLRADKP